MAENQFSNMPSSMRDVQSYMSGGPAPGNYKDYFSQSSQQGDYLELLARLLKEERFRALVDEWHTDKETGKKTVGAFENDPMYGAALAKGGREVPSYVDQPIAGKDIRYR